MANSPEIYWLTLTTIVTGLMWLPYILQIILHRGLNSALSDANGVVMAGMIYFSVRMLHYIVYVLGLPYLRTITFAAGVACQAVFAIALLS